jgi:hypothetical protein
MMEEVLMSSLDVYAEYICPEVINGRGHSSAVDWCVPVHSAAPE